MKKNLCYTCQKLLNMKQYQTNMCLCGNVFCDEHFERTVHDCEVLKYMTDREKRMASRTIIPVNNHRFGRPNTMLNLREIMSRRINARED